MCHDDLYKFRIIQPEQKLFRIKKLINNSKNNQRKKEKKKNHKKKTQRKIISVSYLYM